MDRIGMEELADESRLLDHAGLHAHEPRTPKSRRTPLVVSLLVLGAVCVAAIPKFAPGGPSVSDALLKHASRLDEVLSIPDEEKCDFYIFTHVPNPKDLDNFNEYPLDDLVTDSEGKAGILVMWVMPAKEWGIMLEYVHQITTTKNMTAPSELVDLNETCHEKMIKHKSDGSFQRVRMLSPLDFIEPLLAIRYRLGTTKFQKWFGHTTYDAPKLVGSIMRIRALGNTIPVFRFDIDIICSRVTKEDNMKSIKHAVSQGVDDFLAALADIRVKTFVLSQQYYGVESANTKDFNAWNEAYSTRCNPALLATPALVNASQWSERDGNECFWGSYTPSPEALLEATDERVMLAFYGLEPKDGEDFLQPVLPSSDPEADILKLGNTYIGANPATAIISGAALSTGPGTTLDVPPWIHADLNIMWIDDHILDKSTQEIMGTKKFPRPEGVGTAKVIKARAQPSNPAKFTLEIYMPTLLYGILMDVWVNNHTDAYLLKYHPEDLPSDLADKLASLKPDDGIAQGTATRAMQQVRRQGVMIQGQELKDFKADMWSDALQRIRDTYYQWVNMPEPEIGGTATPSFAALWIAGRVCKHPGLERYCECPTCSKLGQGMISPEWDKKARKAAEEQKLADLPKLTEEDLLPGMKEKVEELIQTVATQLEWILTWPHVIQAVRGEEAGHLASDLFWNPSEPTYSLPLPPTI